MLTHCSLNYSAISTQIRKMNIAISDRALASPFRYIAVCLACDKYGTRM